MHNKNILSIDYDSLTITAMRDLVKKVLGEVSKNGLPDKHHFYITFTTKYKENTLPNYLTKDYPDNMMIVIENEFWNLKVLDSHFLVDLKFKGKIETLKIMYDSLISFVDPSVSFNLNLDLIGSKKPVQKTKKIQQRKSARLENKSNIIYLKPNKN